MVIMSEWFGFNGEPDDEDDEGIACDCEFCWHEDEEEEVPA